MPGNFSDREIFVQWLSDNYSEEDVWKFLYYLLAPVNFGGFYQVCCHYLNVLPFMREFQETSKVNEYDLEIWTSICSDVKKSEKTLKKIFGDIFSKISGPNEHPPTYGQIIDFPLATALYHDLEFIETNTNYYKLFALILSCQIKFLKHYNDFSIDNYKNDDGESKFLNFSSSSFEKMGKLLREFTYSNNLNFVEKVSEENHLKEGCFYQRISKLEYEDPENPTINTIRVYLDRAWINLEEKDWGGSGSTAGRTHLRRYGYVQLGNEFIYESPKTPDKKRKCYKKIKLPPGFKDEWEQSGLLLEEIFSDLYEEIDTDEYFEADETTVPESAKRVLTEIEIRYSAIHNNHLHTAWSKRTKKESSDTLNYFVNHAEDTMIQINNSEKNVRQLLIELETITILLTMLITGSSWKKAKRLLVLESKSYQKSEMVFLSDKSLWRIKIKLTNRVGIVLVNEKEYVEENTDILLLPDFFNIGKYIAKIKNIHDKIKFEKLTPIKQAKAFKSDDKLLKKQAKLILKEFNNKKRINLTTSNVSKIIQKSIITVSGGDAVVAEMITGARGLGNPAQHHYAMPTPLFLENRYRAAILIFNERLKRLQIPSENSNSKRITNWKCAKTKAIKDCLHNMRKIISNKKKITTLDELAEKHNAYTIYTLIGFLIATGYRFSIDPELDPKFIDKNGILVFADKVSGDFYQTRLAWMPEDIVEQLQYYSIHRVRALGMLFSKGQFGKTYFNKKNTFVFFIDPETFEPVEVRPSNWSDIVKDFFPLPMNFSRAYMRTRLMLGFCQVDVMQAYMGHVQNGLESYGKKSSLSPMIYKSTIQPYFEKVFKEIKFIPIKGFK